MQIYSTNNGYRYPEKYKELACDMAERLRYSMPANQTRWTEADTDIRLRAGDKTAFGELFPTLPAEKLSIIPVNRIQADCETIAGLQRNTRKMGKFFYRNMESEPTANQLTKLAQASMFYDEEDAYETFSTAFDSGALTTGLGMIHLYADYRRDPFCGDLRTSYMPFRSYILDADWDGSINFTNLKFLHTFKAISKQCAISYYPQYKQIIQDKPAHTPIYLQNPISDRCDLTLLEVHWHRAYRSGFGIYFKPTGFYTDWNGSEEKLNELLSLTDQFEAYETVIKTWRRALIINGCVVEDDFNPMGIDDLPFIPVCGYMTPDLSSSSPYRIQGKVRGMGYTQYLYNRHLTLNLYAIEKGVFPRYLLNEKLLVDNEDIENPTSCDNLYAREDAKNLLFRQLDPPTNIIAPNNDFLNRLKDDMNYSSGVNQEVSGSASNDIAAALAMARQGAGINSQQTLFDRADKALCRLTRIMGNYFMNNFLPTKIMNMIGEKPTQAFDLRIFPQYQIVAKPANLSERQKMTEANLLIQLRSTLGIPIRDERIIKELEFTDGREIIQEIAEDKAAQQQAAQQQQMAAAPMQQAQVGYLQALSQKDLSQAGANQEKALLDRTKAIKEIQSIPLQKDKQVTSIIKEISSSLK